MINAGNKPAGKSPLWLATETPQKFSGAFGNGRSKASRQSYHLGTAVIPAFLGRSQSQRDLDTAGGLGFRVSSSRPGFSRTRGKGRTKRRLSRDPAPKSNPIVATTIATTTVSTSKAGTKPGTVAAAVKGLGQAGSRLVPMLHQTLKSECPRVSMSSLGTARKYAWMTYTKSSRQLEGELYPRLTSSRKSLPEEGGPGFHRRNIEGIFGSFMCELQKTTTDTLTLRFNSGQQSVNKHARGLNQRMTARTPDLAIASSIQESPVRQARHDINYDLAHNVWSTSNPASVTPLEVFHILHSKSSGTYSPRWTPQPSQYSSQQRKGVSNTPCDLRTAISGVKLDLIPAKRHTERQVCTAPQHIRESKPLFSNYLLNEKVVQGPASAVQERPENPSFKRVQVMCTPVRQLAKIKAEDEVVEEDTDGHHLKASLNPKYI